MPNYTSLEPSTIYWVPDWLCWQVKPWENGSGSIWGEIQVLYEPMGINASIFQAEVFAIKLCVRLKFEKTIEENTSHLYQIAKRQFNTEFMHHQLEIGLELHRK